MKIKGNSIRSLSRVLRGAGGKTNVRLAVNLSSVDQQKLMELGFNADCEVGDFLIPSAIGKISHFNAHGREVIRKDLPKRPESIMYFGTTRDWHGGLHSSTKTRTVQKYPREFIAAPSEQLEIIQIDGVKHVSSSQLNLTDNNEYKNIHVCNLLLECFGEFEIFDTDSGKIIGPTLRRLQWEILPKGQYPWAKSKDIIATATTRLAEKDKKVIEHRMQRISRHNPDFLATGRGGFSGYFVYGFESKGVYVLESIHLDNATYVFYSDWEALSQLTKNEIINSNLPHLRIIHNNRWASTLGQAINKKM